MLLQFSGFFKVVGDKIQVNNMEFNVNTAYCEEGYYSGAISVNANYEAFTVGLTKVDMTEALYESLCTHVIGTSVGKCLSVKEYTSKNGKPYFRASFPVFNNRETDVEVSKLWMSGIVKKETPYLGNYICITGFASKGMDITLNEQEVEKGLVLKSGQTFSINLDKSSVSMAGWAGSGTVAAPPVADKLVDATIIPAKIVSSSVKTPTSLAAEDTSAF
jgi:hypothetical protein